jgi:glyoxylase-like metal-dependent hydrolase (beta-lactamase superfamily II)
MSGVPNPVDEVADGVFFARATEVNFLLLRDGREVTLIDTGYPGDRDRVEAALHHLGAKPQTVAAILLTHAHIDHIGSVNHFAASYGTPVYTDAVEVRHAHREYLEQASPADVARNLWRPGVLTWLTRVMRVGVTQQHTLPSVRPFPGDGELDLPGRPTPVPTRGHTSGHTAYLLRAHRAVVTGDELVTGHAVLRTTGPATLPAFFNHGDTGPALDVLASVDADLILPGHGAPLRMPIAEAVRLAR